MVVVVAAIDMLELLLPFLGRRNGVERVGDIDCEDLVFVGVLSCDDDDDDDDVVGEEDGATATAPPLPLLEAGIRRVAPLIIFSPLSIDNDDDQLLSRTPRPHTIGIY